jgi:phosphohistidine phosphatase
MKLLVIRHGPAGDSALWTAQGRDDRARPLTSEGKKEMRQVARALVALVPKLDILATSPLTRAAQTAEIVAREYDCEIETLEALTPDREPDQALRWLQKKPAADTVAVVGHEPHLSTFVGYLLTGDASSFIDLKKSGACLLDMADKPQRGRGMLEWLLSPRVLNRLGD